MSELERRIASHVERGVDAQSPVTLAEVTTRRALRDRRRPIVAGAVALAFAATAIAVASRDDRGGVPIIANTSSTTATTASTPNTSVETTTPPAGVHTELILDRTTYIQGEYIRAKLVVENNTDAAITIGADVDCAPELAIRLVAPDQDPMRGSRPVCRGDTEIPGGRSEFLVTAITTVGVCTGSEQAPDMPIPQCLEQGPPPLRPGDYPLVVEGWFPPLPEPVSPTITLIEPPIDAIAAPLCDSTLRSIRLTGGTLIAGLATSLEEANELLPAFGLDRQGVAPTSTIVLCWYANPTLTPPPGIPQPDPWLNYGVAVFVDGQPSSVAGVHDGPPVDRLVA